MITTQLQNLGLTSLEATIYAYLIENGPSTASKVSRMTQVQRSMSYIVIQSLIEKELVYRDDRKKVARFGITNPEKLSECVHDYTITSETAQTAYKTIIEQIKQEYAIQSGQPGIRFFIGIEGLKQLYADINRSGVKEIYLVRSNERPATDMFDVITKQVKQQVNNGVSVKVVNSSADFNITEYMSHDSTNRTERRVLPAEIYKNPAQIIIYGNKVGFTTYTDPMFTVVIEHSDIATTLSSMYEYIWMKSVIDTDFFMSKHKKVL